jgi:hypothetical protein
LTELLVQVFVSEQAGELEKAPVITKDGEFCCMILFVRVGAVIVVVHYALMLNLLVL